MLMSFLRPFARIGLAVALVFAASSAHAQDVGYNAMPGADFAKFSRELPDLAAQMQRAIEARS